MSAQAVLLLALQASIFLTVLTIGMNASGADLRSVFSNTSRLVRALLALNVLRRPASAEHDHSAFDLNPPGCRPRSEVMPWSRHRRRGT